MKNNLTAEKMKSPIDELLDEISPIEQRKTDTRMLLAARINDAMRAKGWKNKDLMEALDRNTPSIITKWLSGTHNFTMDTLVELESVLDISLLNLRPEKPKITFFTIAVSQKATIDTALPNFVNLTGDFEQTSMHIKLVQSQKNHFESILCS
jgi:ribosome-binding protein aMBF1 (putative translation factor)